MDTLYSRKAEKDIPTGGTISLRKENYYGIDIVDGMPSSNEVEWVPGEHLIESIKIILEEGL